MTNVTNARWPDFMGCITGLWMFFSPWFMDYTHLPYAAWSAYVIGGALVVAEVVSLIRPAAWEEMFDIVLGVLLIASPYALEFTAHPVVALNAILVGVTVIGLAFWGLLEDVEFCQWWHDHMQNAG
jgi:hypothetical protein